MTDVVDLKVVADYTIPIPTGAHFYHDEIGVICSSGSAISVQPFVRFGISGSLAKQRAATITVNLTAAHKRDSYIPLVPQDGETSLTFGVTVAATAATMKGRAFWRGILLEDET